MRSSLMHVVKFSFVIDSIYPLFCFPVVLRSAIVRAAPDYGLTRSSLHNLIETCSKECRSIGRRAVASTWTVETTPLSPPCFGGHAWNGNRDRRPSSRASFARSARGVRGARQAVLHRASSRSGKRLPFRVVREAFEQRPGEAFLTT